MPLTTDTDLLYWEPNLFRDAQFASQLLIAGTGTLSGSAFVIDAGSLTAARIEAGHVLVLTGAVAGSFPIVQVSSDTSLVLSVLYDGIFPPLSSVTPIPIGSAADLAFAIRTFSPQRRVVTDLLLRAAGLEPAATDDPTSPVLNPDALRRACTLGSLQMIYNALAAAATEPADLKIRAELYERLFRRALRQSSVEIDTNDDGQPDRIAHLGTLQMRRG